MPRRFLVSALMTLAVLAAGCGGLGVGGSPAGDDSVLRVAASVDYPSQEPTLMFWSGDVEFGTDVWASHTVKFEIATDEWIQHVSLHDLYVIEGSELVPAEGSEEHEYTLSDEGPFGGAFNVEIGELAEGDHPVSLSVPLSLEPQPRHTGAAEARELTLRIELVYHVWTEPADVDPGFPTVEELNAADIEDAEDLGELLACGGVMSFHHRSVDDADDALSLATTNIRDMEAMGGHGELVEAIAVGRNEDGAESLWAIVDSNGYVVGSVEKGQAIFMCENKPPYYEPPNVGTPYPPCEGPDERNDPDCEA